MARPVSVVLSRGEMDQLVDSLAILDKVRHGTLSDVPIEAARRVSHSFPGGSSDIVRHQNAAGFQVATTHRITTLQGQVAHWHCKDLRIGDVLIRYED